MPKMHVEEVRAQLNQIREQQGEQAFTKARDAVIGMLIHQPKGEDFLKLAFPDVDLEPFRKANTPNHMLELLKAQTPNLKNDIQLQLLLAGSETYLTAMNALFAGDKPTAEKAIEALMDCFDMAEKSVQVAEQVANIPAEERSVQADAFTRPCGEPQISVFSRLMEGLTAVSTVAELNTWYGQNRQDLDLVIDRVLRDSIFDQIRAKKSSFEN